MNLIDRAAAIEEVDGTVTSVSVCATVEQARGATWAKGRIRERLEKMPTVPAVPLDKLCEWLESWDIQVIPCNVCKNVFHLKGCPHGPFDCGDAEHWKILLTKWMEEQQEKEKG